MFYLEKAQIQLARGEKKEAENTLIQTLELPLAKGYYQATSDRTKAEVKELLKKHFPKRYAQLNQEK